MDLFVLLTIAAAGWILVTLVGSVSGISAKKRVLALEFVVRNLRIKIDELERSISRQPGVDNDIGDRAQQEVPVQPVPPTGEAAGPEEAAEETDRDTAAETPPIAASAATPTTRDTLEQNITSKWFVWLGGVALALSGIFVVKYSIEHGLLGPTTRVVLGVLMAMAFGVTGEWIRRRQPQAAAIVSNQALIPAALSAAAVATAFGSVYAGYALYGLFSSTVAFLLLVLIAAIAVLLSMLHGPFVAALGLVGAYLVPVLVSTGSHSAWRLFLFLTVINAGGLAVVRHFAWRWLQNAVLAVAMLWALLWIALHPGGSDAITLSLYLLVLLLLVFLPALWSVSGTDGGVYDKYVALAAAVGVTLLFSLLVVRAEHSLVSVGGFCLLALTLLAIAYRNQEFELLSVLGAVASVLILVAWKWQNITLAISALPGGPKVVSVDPVSIRSLWTAALLFGGLFGLAGYAGVWRARRPGIWAAVSAATPVLMFAIVYWRAFDLEIDLRWASIGILLAGLALLCAWWVSKHRAKPGFDEVLGGYAVAVVAAIALACAMALRDAWLTVALAVTVPAIAWIYSRLEVIALRYTAAVIGVVVLIRLALNLYIFDYGLEGWLGFNWILYGYGIPALAFYMAVRLFRRSEDGRLVLLLESASLLFFVLLLSFEIRHLVGGGRLDMGRYEFTEQALQSVAWGVTAFGLLRQFGKGKRMVPLWGYRILGSMAIAQIVLLQCLLFNPIWRSTDVGAWPVLNMLAIAYLMPAILCILANREARLQGEKILEQATGALSLVLIFVYSSLEFRHIFRGAHLNAGTISDAELYGYSICWLVLAGILLFFAVLKKLPSIRYGSLAVTLLVIGKVFFVDMANLTGLYRAGSFLALGIVLLGIGYFYQRFVFAPPVAEDST